MEQDIYNRMRNRPAAARAPSVRPILGAVLAAFLLGGVVVGLVMWNGGFGLLDGETAPPAAEQGQDRVPLALASPETKESAEAATASTNAAAAVQAVEMVASQQGGIEARVTAMEQRLTALDIQAQAAYGNAARAEALLVAFAARRAVERGAPLDYLEQQLKVRFEDSFPNAVTAVLEAAKQPTTIDRLRAGIDGLGPQLLEDPAHESTWEWIKRELTQLFVIRKQSTPSPAPIRRLDRARIYLESGQVDNAIAEVRQMPGADRASRWIADAERYAAALRALDRLETSAIVGPEGARDIGMMPPGPAAGSGAQ